MSLAEKKGQVTIFALMGLTLLIGIMLVLHTTNTDKKVSFAPQEQSNLLSVKESAEFFTQSCLDSVLKEALDRLGENGGHIYRTQNLKIQYTQDYTFTFLYIDRNDFLPDLEAIQSDIERYINENLRYCADDFEVYEKQGWGIELAQIGSKVTIAEEDVTAVLDFPAKFTMGKTSFDLGKFFARNPTSIKKIIREAGNLLKDAKDAQQKIDSGKQPSVPPQSFTRNGLLFLDYQYPDTGRFLWIIKDGKYEFFFAVNLET